MTSIDLNLIRAFIVLFEARSVTQAADRLNVTQPSVSYALARLRDRFNDRLFVRSGAGMEPTLTASQMYPALRQALAQIEGVVEDNREFVAARSHKCFRLAMTDLGEMALLPRILAQLHASAPNVELEVVPLEIDKVANWLNADKVNAAICSRPIRATGIARRVLFEERYVCLLNRDHEGIGDHLSLEQFTRARHAVVAASSGHGLAEDVLNERGLERKISLRVPHFSVLPPLLQQSDLLAIVPQQIAEAFTRSAALKILDLPFEVPPFDVALHWHGTAAASAAQRWLHEQIVAAISTT
ncbi:LysR family transcriptional regulator [Halomonas sp. V046]|uniref:LysR family transcriptional regulator n=1 Tax=Halomonas sp. V046 TaxID=3459611 RepID=UPI004044E129